MAERTPLQMLEEQQSELEQKLVGLKRAIDELRKLEAFAPADSRFGSDDFSHMEVVDAVVKLLSKLGRSATLDEMLPILRRHGADLGGTPERHGRVLKTSVRMNSKRPNHPLVYEESTGMVSLRQRAGRKAAG